MPTDVSPSTRGTNSSCKRDDSHFFVFSFVQHTHLLLERFSIECRKPKPKPFVLVLFLKFRQQVIEGLKQTQSRKRTITFDGQLKTTLTSYFLIYATCGFFGRGEAGVKAALASLQSFWLKIMMSHYSFFFPFISLFLLSLPPVAKLMLFIVSQFPLPLYGVLYTPYLSIKGLTKIEIDE